MKALPDICEKTFKRHLRVEFKILERFIHKIMILFLTKNVICHHNPLSKPSSLSPKAFHVNPYPS